MATKDAVLSNLLCGGRGNKTFTHDGVALMKQSYFYLGRFFALGILQGGCGPQCFAHAVAEMILYEERNHSPHINIKDVPDREVQETLEKV
jgi:hypothetical protein